MSEFKCVNITLTNRLVLKAELKNNDVYSALIELEERKASGDMVHVTLSDGRPAVIDTRHIILAEEASDVACEACMSVSQRPCYQCERRVASPNCHDNCRVYLIRMSVDRALKDKARLGMEADMVSRVGRDRCIKRQHRKVKIRPRGDWRG